MKIHITDIISTDGIHDDVHMDYSRSQPKIFKSSPDSVSVERTRQDKFRRAFRTVSKVAFSQLGLGK